MPYAVVIPGGGFNRQWGLIEGFCIAVKLMELGISSYVLFYRTKQEPVIGKAKKHDAIRIANGPFLRRIGGPDFNRKTLSPYELSWCVDSSYPPCYITACIDDDTVPVDNAYHMDQLLIDNNVPHKINIGEKGGHSFGLGLTLSVADWPQDMLAFLKSLSLPSESEGK